jgi:hypothetical protein
MTEREAYRRMRDESRRLRRPIREIAQAVLLVEALAQERPALLTPEVKDLDLLSPASRAIALAAFKAAKPALSNVPFLFFRYPQ